MTATIARFHSLLERAGSDVVVHRESQTDPCPCRTSDGFRDPTWHVNHPDAPVCNERGFLATVTEFAVKGSVQPAQTGYTRLAQRANELLGDVRRDDRFAVIPCEWGGNEVDLSNWSDAGDEFLLYDELRYTVVSFDTLPDVDGDPRHHYECGLRLLSAERP